MNYPDWWAQGVSVTGSDGTQGTVGRSGSGGWLVHLEGEEGDSAYVINPDPGYWQPVVGVKLTPTQLQRIVYESDRALLLAMGCGGIAEWTAVPESVRVHDNPIPQPKNRPELGGLRAILTGAIRAALAAHTSSF